MPYQPCLLIVSAMLAQKLVAEQMPHLIHAVCAALRDKRLHAGVSEQVVLRRKLCAEDVWRHLQAGLCQACLIALMQYPDDRSIEPRKGSMQAQKQLQLCHADTQT